MIAVTPIFLGGWYMLASVAYWQGHAEGEASVACAPNDGNLPDLLKCYQDKAICEEVLASKSGKARSVAKNMKEWNGITMKEDDRGIYWPFTCEYFPSEYGC